jgi:uncharacterized protein YoxC
MTEPCRPQNGGIDLAKDLAEIVSRQQSSDASLLRRASDFPGTGSHPGPGGNGKVVVGLVGLLSSIIVAGLAAYTTHTGASNRDRIAQVESSIQRQLQQSQDAITERVDGLLEWAKRQRDDLQHHVETPAHAGIAERVAGMLVSFTEIETQFRGLRERLDLEIRNLTDRSNDRAGFHVPRIDRHDAEILDLMVRLGILENHTKKAPP